VKHILFDIEPLCSDIDEIYEVREPKIICSLGIACDQAIT
jgi:hypothetical protein